MLWIGSCNIIIDIIIIDNMITIIIIIIVIIIITMGGLLNHTYTGVRKMYPWPLWMQGFYVSHSVGE